MLKWIITVALEMTSTLNVSKKKKAYSSIYLSLKVMSHGFKNLDFSFNQLSRAKCVVVRLMNTLMNALTNE